MSAKDNVPAGEVEDKKTNFGASFDSPNITNASDDIDEPIVDDKEEARKAAQKKAETVDIDGVPIPEAEQKFKSEDIKKHEDLLVNVDRREEEKKARRAAKQDESILRRERARSRSADFRKKLKSFLFDRWHKYVLIAIIIAILVGCYFWFIHPVILAEIQRCEEAKLAKQMEQEKKEIEKILNFEEEIKRAHTHLANFEINEALTVYENLLKNTSDNEQLIRIYTDRSEMLFRNPQYSQQYRELEINDAKAAYELDHNSTVALMWLSVLYHDLGNQAEHEKYQQLYEEAQARIDEEAAKQDPDKEGKG